MVVLTYHLLIQRRKSGSAKHEGVQIEPHGKILMLKVRMVATTAIEVGHQERQPRMGHDV